MKKQRTSHYETMENRSFQNPFPAYNEEMDQDRLLESDGMLNTALSNRINTTVNKLLKELQVGFAPEDDTHDKDTSVYTGNTGIAMLYLHLYNITKQDNYIKLAKHYVDISLLYLKEKRITFLCGDPGPLAVAAVVYDKLGKKKDSEQFINRLGLLHQDIFEDGSANELMYGRAGYLFALMYIKSYFGIDEMPDLIPDQIAVMILNLGKRLARKHSCQSPMMFEWHDKYYLGAAHGLAGILTLLLQCSLDPIEDHLQDLIQPSVDFLMKLQFASGNFPSSLSNDTDRLIHWCHGAPGVIHMLILAYKKFKDDKYLAAAYKCSDVIWQYGLLRKGYGLCHGTAGNGYAFVALYRATKDKKQLYRACKFAEWCLDYGKHGCRIPDRPFSLYEGLAGTIYFLKDMLNPSEAKFPGFYI